MRQRRRGGKKAYLQRERPSPGDLGRAYATARWCFRLWKEKSKKKPGGQNQSSRSNDQKHKKAGSLVGEGTDGAGTYLRGYGQSQAKGGKPSRLDRVRRMISAAQRAPARFPNALPGVREKGHKMEKKRTDARGNE